MRENARKILLYAVWAALCLVVSLYVLFPGQKARSFVEARFARSAQGLTLNMAQASLVWPLSLRLEEPRFYSADGSRIFALDFLEISASPFDLWAGRPDMTLSGKAYGGRIRAVLASQGEEGAGPVSVTVNLENLDASGIQILKRVTEREITGTLTGRLEIKGPLSRLLSGQGKGDFSLTDGGFSLEGMFADNTGMDVERLDVEMVLEGGAIQLSRIELAGNLASANATGTINPAVPLAHSKLDIRGMIRPSQALFQKLGSDSPLALAIRGNRQSSAQIRFRVTGTLGDRRLELL
ncbi:MAG: type II secretion system protein GspN [Pseudomonadota bacterium]